MRKISEALDQYTGICKEAIVDSAAKLGKSFEKVIIEILLLYMVVPGKINFTQLGRYGRHCEQCYRQNFGRRRSKSINWLRFNISLALRYFGGGGRMAIAIDPSFISKAGKKTPHIGRFWSGCAGAVKHGLEIMGLGLINLDVHNCMMLRAHQTPSTSDLKMRNKSLTEHYIGVVKRYSKELLRLSHLIVADAFFSNGTFYNGIRKYGFHLISRFRDDAHLCYLYEGERTGKRGRPRVIDGKIDYKRLDKSRMQLLSIEGLMGKAYTLPAYSKSLKCKVRLVIWQMPDGKHKLFFSTDTTLTGEEVLDFYRTRFQIEFCYRDAKNYTGLMDSQARDPWKLDFAFNASFASLNVAKLMMKERGMDYSMSNFKTLMAGTFLTKRIFDVSRYRPNQTLINHIFKELFGCAA
ncbi:MAG: transposase [Bacteroidaceae bacterium]|nr:transposase [Bacteroidaceae bacterium]